MGGVLRMTSHLTIRCIQEPIQKVLVGRCNFELGLTLIMQKRLDPETGVNKPFENVLCKGRIQKFFQRGGINFRRFFKRSFFRQS